MDLLNSGHNMESTSRDLERDCAFGSLFQQIINEMKSSSPLWEDMTAKSTKLHSCLRATIQALGAFLDTFQKIADAATSTKGATKDIGTALTRICLRHKALEAKLKTFTSSILDSLIIPLQERLEEWKRVTMSLDKAHAKEYRRGRTELRKKSIETLRLQKKVRKGSINNGGMSGSFSGTLQKSAGIGNISGMSISSGGETFQQAGGGNRDLHRILEISMRDMNEKRQAFEDVEKQAIRTALVEERSRFCLFVSFLKPVVDDEVEILSELSHIQEAMQQLEKHSTDPFVLPPSSEQVISDLKGSNDNGAWFQTPPSSPSSLGSRKSSMCSISSANSSSSGSAHSPPRNVQQRVIPPQPPTYQLQVGPGPVRYSSVSSQDSGFTSQDTLFSRMPTYGQPKGENQSEGSNPSSTASSNSSTPSSPYPPGTITTTNTTWPNLQDSIQFERAACAIMNERPHTISSAYERGHQRPPLTVYTFQEPTGEQSSHSVSAVSPTSSTPRNPTSDSTRMQGSLYQSASEIYGILRGRNDVKPPVPKRGSSLERPTCSTASTRTTNYPNKGSKNLNQDTSDGKTPVLPDFNQSSPDMIVPQPVYVNMHELNQMAAAKRLRQQQTGEHHPSELPPPPPELMTPSSKSDATLEGVMTRSDYSSNNTMNEGRSFPISEAIGGSGGSGSSAISCSSSTTIEAEDLSCSCFDVLSGYCTLPRNFNHNGCCSYAHYNDYDRLKTHQEKPQPPMRHSSSLSATPSRNTSNNNSPTSAMPPNIFVQQKNSQSYPGQHQMAAGENFRDSMDHISQSLTSENMTADQKASNMDDSIKHVNVAETIKSLTEKNHQPVSPNMIRRSNSLKHPDDQDCVLEIKNSSNWSNPTSKERSNLIHVLNQKLTQGLSNQPVYGHLTQPAQKQKQQQPIRQQQSLPHQFYQQIMTQQQPIYQQVASQSASNSPRHPRRFSEELLKTTATFVQTRVLGNKTPPPVVSSKEMFVQTLNAKLSQMRVGSPPTERRLSSPSLKTSFTSKLVASVSHHHHPKGNEMSTAYRVRQWIAARTVADPSLCRESLMDQIRRGTKLKHTRTINDRSAPRIH